MKCAECGRVMRTEGTTCAACGRHLAQIHDLQRQIARQDEELDRMTDLVERSRSELASWRPWQDLLFADGPVQPPGPGINDLFVEATAVLATPVEARREEPIAAGQGSKAPPKSWKDLPAFQ